MDIGRGIGEALFAGFIATIIVSAVAGWALIEGLIWIFHHIHIGWAP